METAADRAVMLEALGGEWVAAPGGQFMAIFDHAHIVSDDIEGTVPVLTCQTEDVERLRLQKGTAIDVPGQPTMKVRRLEPDGTGMHRVVLGA